MTEPGERLFSIFDTDDPSSDDLLRQVESDLQTWGFNNFACRRMAGRITEGAKTAAAITDDTTGDNRFVTATETNDRELIEHLAAERGDGVTCHDIRWYWSVHPIARTAMRLFDEELGGRMSVDRLGFNLCMEDLEQDVKRQLPVFGEPIIDDKDSPLPHELRRRFALFIARTKQDQATFADWNSRLQRASSMNALIRELILSGDF